MMMKMMSLVKIGTIIALLTPSASAADCKSNPGACMAVKDETSLMQVQTKLELGEDGGRGCEDENAKMKAAIPEAGRKAKIDGKEQIIQNCGDLRDAGWCSAPAKAHNEFFGQVCPKSCNWCECEDQNDHFKMDCDTDQGCKDASKGAGIIDAHGKYVADPCAMAAEKFWCHQTLNPALAEKEKEADSDKEARLKKKADAEKGEAWVTYVCAKSCCKKGAEIGVKHKKCEKKGYCDA